MVAPTRAGTPAGTGMPRAGSTGLAGSAAGDLGGGGRPVTGASAAGAAVTGADPATPGSTVATSGPMRTV